MNTKAKGDLFENRVYNALTRIIEFGDIPVSNKYKIYQHKVYQAGAMTVNTDISIEMYTRSHPEEPSLIIIIECKSLNSNLPVEDYQEWLGKITSIRQSGIKLYIATTKGFAKSVVKDSRLKGVSLIVFDKEDNWNVIVPRIEYDKSSNRYVNACIPNIDCNAPYIIESDIEHDLCTHFKSLGFRLKEKKIPPIKFLSKSDIKNIVKDIIDQISKVNIDIPIEYKVILLTAKMPPKFKSLPTGVLGAVNLSQKEIWISDSISSVPRTRFTIAHEIGHIILHRDLFDMFDVIQDLDYKDFQNDSESNIYQRMEWQCRIQNEVQ